MFSAEYGTGALGEFFAAEPVAWGQPFFETVTPAPTAPPPADTGLYVFEQPGFLSWLGGGPLSEPEIGPGGAERAATAARLRAEEAAALAAGAAERAGEVAGAAAEYVSGIPGAIGEAGGELVAELGAGVGAGLGAVVAPIVAAPGALLEGIPVWVPLLGAAFLLTRN